MRLSMPAEGVEGTEIVSDEVIVNDRRYPAIRSICQLRITREVETKACHKIDPLVVFL